MILTERIKLVKCERNIGKIWYSTRERISIKHFLYSNQTCAQSFWLLFKYIQHETHFKAQQKLFELFSLSSFSPSMTFSSSFISFSFLFISEDKKLQSMWSCSVLVIITKVNASDYSKWRFSKDIFNVCMWNWFFTYIKIVLLILASTVFFQSYFSNVRSTLLFHKNHWMFFILLPFNSLVSPSLRNTQLLCKFLF